MEKNSHGESLISPKFDTQGGAVEWIRKRREEFDQVGMWRRTSRANGEYEDEPLYTEDAPRPDRERLHALVADLKDMLADKKRQLDKEPTARSYSSVGGFNPIERPLTYEELYGEQDA
jgi:hypothetical protein